MVCIRKCSIHYLACGTGEPELAVAADVIMRPVLVYKLVRLLSCNVRQCMVMHAWYF